MSGPNLRVATESFVDIGNAALYIALALLNLLELQFQPSVYGVLFSTLLLYLFVIAAESVNDKRNYYL